MIRARAPVRIDFAGGWTDVPRFYKEHAGSVTNAAINIYTYASVSFQEVGISIHNINTRQKFFAQRQQDIVYNGELDIPKAVCKKLGVDNVSIVISTEAPIGSGLGTSASLETALITALLQYKGYRECASKVAEIAFEVETLELGLNSGKQDQYASSLGGIRTYYFDEGSVRLGIASPSKEFCMLLEKCLVLCWTGTSRLSSDIHSLVYENYDKGLNRHALAQLRYSSLLAEDALLCNNLEALADAVNVSWQAQKSLHPSIDDEVTHRLFDAAIESKAFLAGKATGAGGGCLLFVAKPDMEVVLREFLTKAGASIINFSFDFEGARVF